MEFLPTTPNNKNLEQKIIDLLKRSSLSVTDSRKKILESFFQKNSALAHADIELQVGDEFDRVTIYRTLQTFVDKGIIHTIPTPDNAVLYALCKDSCSAGHHHDNHVHFICDNCNKTYCLEHVVVPTIAMPNNFVASQIDMVVSGVCDFCNASS
jgi:Fur family ferric uptake transcriptional regulator